jgi:hypothetical protein
MGKRAFIICLVVLAVVVLLCATPFPGALVGFLFGITVAFFVAPVVFIVVPVLRNIGLAITDKQFIYVLVALYGLATLAIFLKAWLTWRRGDVSETRLFVFQGIVFAALPLMAFLSSQALVKSWP